MRKSMFGLLGVIALALVFIGLTTQSTNAQSNSFPKIIALPDGYQPEGVVVGNGPVIYAGSLADGSVYQANLRTGEGAILVPPQNGMTIAVGLSFDSRSNYLFVAGGPFGNASVYDAATGELVQRYALSAGFTFINDVIVTREAAYFTDSFAAVLYRVPLGPAGQLAGAVETIPLGGDFVLDLSGPFPINTNGIEATPNGKYLIIVNSATRTLYRVDPQTGDAEEIDLGGAALPNGDGLLLLGKELFVVQNFLNQIAVVELSNNYARGEITRTITDANFRIPTTVADFGDRLYAVNARFDVEAPTAETEYEIVQVPRN